MTDRYSDSAERAVISGMLQNEDLLNKGVDVVSEADFHMARNRAIYRTMHEMFNESVPVDPVTVAERMDAENTLENNGGVDYIASLVDVGYNHAGFDEYAEMVRDNAVKRRICEACEHILEESKKTPHNRVEELVNRAEHLIYNASTVKEGEGLRSVSESTMDTMAQIEARMNHDGSVIGVPTGMYKFDHMTSGLNDGRLYVVGARPGMGKSAWRGNAALHHAITHNVPAYLFSLEMSAEEEVERLAVMHSQVHGKKVQSGTLTPAEMSRLAESVTKIHHAPIYIDDTPGVTLSEIRSRLRRSMRAHGHGVVYIDYLQLMGSDERRGTREQEVASISKGLKNLSREMNCPVVLLIQLNREVDKRDDKRPRMSDARESGAIEQDADVMMFIYRESEYEGETNSHGEYIDKDAELIVAKQRNGPKGLIKCKFDKSTMRFYDE